MRRFILLFVLISNPLLAQGGELIYAFRSYTRPEPIKMLLVGEIQSKIKAPQITERESPYRGYDTRLDMVTVKVRTPTGLKVGQKLYIIDKNPYHERFRNGLIVGEITVQSVLKTAFYGWVVTGTGILLRVREGLCVARTQESENLAQAFDLKKKGDFYADSGNRDKAVATYQAALVADRDLPEAHAALGNLFLQEAKRSGREFPGRALAEFEHAWRVRENFRYGYDEMKFYRGYLETLHLAYRIKRVDASSSQRIYSHLDKMREVAEAAGRLLPEDPDVFLNMIRYHLGQVERHRGAQTKEGRKAYDEALKAAGAHFEKLDPLMHDPRSYMKRLEKYRQGERMTSLFSAGEAEFHRVAVIYFGSVLREIRNSPVIEDAAKREKCVQRIRHHGEKFLLYNGAVDPEVRRYMQEAR